MRLQRARATHRDLDWSGNDRVGWLSDSYCTKVLNDGRVMIQRRYMDTYR